MIVIVIYIQHNNYHVHKDEKFVLNVYETFNYIYIIQDQVSKVAKKVVKNKKEILW